MKKEKQPGIGTQEPMNKQPGIGTQEPMNKQPGSGDPRIHEGLVMIDSGASVNVCPRWFGKSKLQQSDGATCLSGANGKPLQEVYFVKAQTVNADESSVHPEGSHKWC